jgi:hypothetical protein
MNFRRRLATLCRRLARWLDPPPDRGDAELEEADRRCLEAWEHAEAGRIRRRRGESGRDFGRRLARGDYVILDNLIDFSAARARVVERKAAAR